MPTFSKKSKLLLVNAHIDLQRVLKRAILRYDFTILCTHRNKADQEKALAEGRSKACYGQSPHNFVPSVAVDIAPYPINWGDTGTPEERKAALHRFDEMHDVIMQCAKELSVPLRWGGDWDGNPATPNKLNDLPHFELNPWRNFAHIG
jgi:peptidoglycan L-alanyl-D-glutamate endopeptidase CwlK